jgi:hypothetical protein
MGKWGYEWKKVGRLNCETVVLGCLPKTCRGSGCRAGVVEGKGPETAKYFFYFCFTRADNTYIMAN